MVHNSFRIVWKILFLIFLLPGCAYLRPAKNPIETLWYRQPENNHTCLLILLPGRYSSADSFSTEGFVAMARKSGITADMVAVDAHLGYYFRRTLLARLRQDVLKPAQEQGYTRFWIVGISLGGLGAVWCDTEEPGALEGIVLLSPYLGDREIVAEVAAVGGVRQWSAPPSGRADMQRDIWRMLKSYENPQRSLGRLFLGYGRQDSFAQPNVMFAELIPASQVFAIEGGHDWPTWRKLWEQILASPEIQGFEQREGNRYPRSD
jgi:pimeloyl-ACP methyl ester carboxylesterase